MHLPAHTALAWSTKNAAKADLPYPYFLNARLSRNTFSSDLPSLPLRSGHGHHSDHRAGDADVHRPGNRCDRRAGPVRVRSPGRGHDWSHGSRIDVLVCRRPDWFRSLRFCAQPLTHRQPCDVSDHRAGNRRVHRVQCQCARSQVRAGDHDFRVYGSSHSP